ncbi:peptidase M61 [Flavobacterium sp. J372]|uniref:M61 family metallopeptidase n=1 Tax=Flavobacterium sp. J372 TaxID=2898436 RepID=UPI002150D52D|nr:peptidase M61 [Flavobacterium sp. J372]MCR5861456.1 peptidase M61 [Flavobacterium sp. J372]
MKKFLCAAGLTIALTAYTPALAQAGSNGIKVGINLKDVKDDKVMVTVTPPKVTTETTTYYIPKIVPGTYSDDNYGSFIEGFKAYDTKGKELAVTKPDVNSWKIANAKKLAKITYLVNDTYDTEGQGTHDVFSPAGTNISPNNYMLNNHGFVGYFDGKGEVPYTVSISHPAALWGATSLIDTDASDTNDVFAVARYADLVDNPIMYSKPDYTTFSVEGMDILISVYSPDGKVTAKSITPEMETMMRAQKRFLGPINSTKKYSVLLYLSDLSTNDAKGFGALEHNTSTTVVMPKEMPIDQLKESLKDVVSHEFFHIVTPLTVHSKEIQYFNFNTPKMSEHLWMYEGITEYFANLFQVNQGLITEDDFYKRMAEKIASSKMFDDTMPFTKMSRNVLEAPYKDAYNNVYEKGALIAMCLDIQIRESSGGKRGILDLMQKLSNEYGSSKAFDDSELFNKVVALTYPEVRTFLDTYVAGNTPIPYEQYFSKMGVTKATVTKTGNALIKGQQEAYITANMAGEIILVPDVQDNEFMTTLGLKGGDVLAGVNGTKYDVNNVYDLIMSSMSWKEGEPITIDIKRDGKTQQVKGKIKLPSEQVEGYKATDASKAGIRNAWLKG